jgi:L-iditol 2-dehydrogenase
MRGLVNFAKEPYSAELRELPVPEIDEDDLLISVRAVGVCGSDLHQYAGTHSWHGELPSRLRLRVFRSRRENRDRVKGFKEGDRVVSETAAVLPDDSLFVRRGLYNLEPKRLGFGAGVDGAMASFIRVPARRLHHLPTSLSFEKAALKEQCCEAWSCSTLSKPRRMRRRSSGSERYWRMNSVAA